MRDKVKRFISILMTALMLVNLLPVGALAEGMKLDSNSVQSIGWWPWPEETWPDGSYKIYVYAKVLKGSVGGINVNKDGWYTLGYIDAQTMPSPIGTLGNLYGGGNAQGYDLGSLNAQSLIQSSAFHFEKNTNIPVRNTPIWSTDGAHGFKACSGATDYPETGNAPTWHLDILVNLKDVTPIHRLVFKVENSSGTQIGSKAIEGTWGQEITYEKGKDVPETITTKDGKIYELKRKNDNLGKTFKFDEVTKQIEFYYKYKGSVNHTLTINYVYEDGSEAAKSYQKTLPYQSYYSVTSPDITGYTADNPVVSGTMPADNVEVTVTYTKRTDLSYTVNYLEKDTEKVLHDAKVQGGMTFEDVVTSADEVIDIDGYNYDSVDKDTLTIGTGDNVINIYYTKKTGLSYTVNYLEKDTEKVLHDAKVQGGMTFEDVVTSADEVIDIDGYNYDSVDKDTLTIGTGDNVINIYYTKRNDLSYTVNYIEKDTTNVLHEQKVQTGMKFETVINPADEKIEIDGYNYVGADKEKLTIGTDENVLTLYYTKNSYRYTVEHYWIGDKDKLDAQPFHTDADESQTALFDSTVAYQENGASWVITTNPVYTFAKADPEKITITFDPSKNVLKLYYYKNVKLIANSDTVTYDGKEHLVFGYTCAVAEMKNGRLEYVPQQPGEKPLIFDGVKASSPAGIKDVGDYAVNFQEKEPIGENNGLYYVNASQTGMLTITPAPITLQASSRSKTYDGTPLEADGYGFYEGNPDLAKDIASVILTGSQTLVGSSESQITEVVLEKEKNPDNYKFTFLPGLLTVTDGTGDDPVKPENVVTKTHIPKDTGYNVGETVTFTVSVKNIYNTPKTITLTEKENVKFSNGENVIVFNDVPAGETVTAEATYTITSADILAGVFHNTVTADFTGGGSWTAEDTVTTAELDTTLNVTKTSDVPEGQKAALGQKITYTIKVQNAGNVPYTNVKVEDPLTKLTATIETLAVGETKTFTTEYVVTEADVLKGSVLNTATATGDKIKDPKSDEPKEPNGGDEVEIKTFAPITIKPKDVTATYNGAAITGKDVEITSGKLLEGHKLSAAVDGSGVNAGSYALTLDPAKIKIVDANNKDVSEMYARTILPGKLIINKRSVLITSQSATKTYDGSALTRPAVTITGDGFVPGELAKAEATGSITKVGSTPNAIRYTTTGAFNAANYSIALSVGTLTVTEKPKPEPRRTFNLTINYVYQNGKRAAASYNRGGLKNGETFDITSPVIAGYTASETVVSGTIYNRDIKVTVIYTADGVNLDDYGVPLGLGNITMNVGDCFE